MDSPTSTQLFEKYLLARDGGVPLDVDALLSEAGPHADDLRARIEVYESVQRIADDAAASREGDMPEALGRFRIVAPIGAGGLGRVFLAYDPRLQRRVALKLLETRGSWAGLARARVLNEARILARLVHPGVLRIFEVGEAGGRDFLVTQYLSGPSLAEVVKELRAPGASADEPVARVAEELRPLDARVRCLRKLADALTYCHDSGVLHRDVKPSNVLFDEEGEPALIDFGLGHDEDADDDSKTDITQDLVGTPAYVSPEQVERGTTGADPRTDVFSFGIVCYELLTLTNPFLRRTRSETLDAITHGRILPLRKLDPSIPSELERVVLHSLERDPDRRYRSMGAVAADLRAVLEYRPVSVREPTLAHDVALWVRRNRRGVSLGAGALTLAVLGLFANHLVTSMDERARILAELDSIEAANPSRPVDFEHTFPALLQLRNEASHFDARLWRRIALGPLTSRVEDSVRLWSRRLGAAIESDVGSATLEEQTSRFGGWRGVVRLEQILCPLCPYNEEYRGHGWIALDEEQLRTADVRLLQQVPIGTQGYLRGVHVFREVPLTELPGPGYYRLVAWERGGGEVLGEHEFVQTGSWVEPLREMTLRRPPSRFYELAVRVEPYVYPIEIPADVNAEARRATLYVAAVRLSGLVTLGDVEGSDDAALFCGPWARAAAFAASLGGRLPTALEIDAAHARGLIDTEPAGVAAEWVSDLSPSMGPEICGALVYDLMVANPGSAPAMWTVPAGHDHLFGMEDGGKTAFRVAFGDDSADALRRAATLVDE